MKLKKYLAGAVIFCLALQSLPVTVRAAEKKEDINTDTVFSDVSVADYYYEPIKWAVNQGIAAGTSEGVFSPNASCTRGQMAAFLWRTAGSPENQGTEMPFQDVPQEMYYYDAIQWAAAQGIAFGTGTDTFSPEAPLTRAQTITFLWRYVGAPTVLESTSFRDVSANAYYFDAVQWAAEQGITFGSGSDTFNPDAPCTRGQIVTFLFRSRSTQTENQSATFEAHSVTTDALGKLGYWLYTPSNPTEQMPLIVYLHGGSGKGDDLSLVTAGDGFPKYLQTGTLGDVRAYVLIPQLPEDEKGWIQVSEPLYQLIRSLVNDYHLDLDNISLTGHSMGGTGTWALAAEYPELFARIAPLSGSARGTEDIIAALDDIPVWAFVGSADTIVPPDASEEIVTALQNAGDTARITVFDGADHFAVPSLTYLDEQIDLVGWLIEENSE